MATIELIHGSCADQNADVIVNAANRYLAEGGGICGVIFKKAGSSELAAACREYKTPLEDGDAVITPAFGLSNAKGIIHAVGPNFADTPEAFDELFAAYFNSLVVLKDNEYHSISFPLISSGIFGGRLENPAKESAKRCCEAVRNFVAKYPDYELKVLLCAFSDSEYQKVLAYFDGNTTKEMHLSTGDALTNILGGRIQEDGTQFRVVVEDGNNMLLNVKVGP
ncbi:MAG: macro domain-containing protein [Lachnospiraceae bacterium]|nr:macro domain-containing protein [Lachnospiraceae bacterium]